MVLASSNGVRRPRDRAAEALLAVLPVGAVGQHPSDSGSRVGVGGVELFVVWAGEGGLGDVRRVLASEPRPDVVVGRHLTPGARTELRSAGVGWVDETGAAEIAVGSIIVSRTGRPDRAPKPPRWTPAVVGVAEALLCGVRGTAAAVTAATGLSTGSGTTALRVLKDLGLLEASAKRGRGSARRVADRRALLDAYATAAAVLKPTMSLRVGVVWRDPVAGLTETGEAWDRKGIRWAATGTAAATVLAPHLGSVTAVDVYVNSASILGLEVVAAAAGLAPIDGGRLTLRPFPTTSTDHLVQTVEGLRVAPWPRVYVDLLDAGVRGEEAAEHLWEVINAKR
jgi:hypothetical protein